MTTDRQTGHHGGTAGTVYVREWAENKAFNSFNNWKGLLYSRQFEEIARGNVPVPIQARIDPTLRCPLNCRWCNSARYRKNRDELPYEHLVKVLEFLAKWGVKAVVWAGGGEPTYHPKFAELLQLNARLGMDAAILSNGVFYDPHVARDIGRYCRWAGISVDAGTRNTYAVAKGVATFEQVLESITEIKRHAHKCNVGFKFLIAPDNQYEIYQACRIAKDIGADDFIARPMDTQHQGMVTADQYDVGEFDVDAVYEQFEQCHELESDDFNVFTVMHKFNPDMSHGKQFSQCYGAPLRIHIATDGNLYFCDDQYYRPEYKIGSHYPDPTDILTHWGGKRHRELLYGGTPAKCTTRCCVGDYCIQCERLFVSDDDPMCRNYP